MMSQQCWHNVISSALGDQLRQNGYSEEFQVKANHFIGNGNEEHILYSKVHLYVFGDLSLTKSENNVADSWY